MFSIDDINQAFNGEFRKIDDSPRPQPNSCIISNSTQYNSTGDYFLMENVVNPINKQDMYNFQGVQMEKLIVDIKVTDNSTCKAPTKYTTYYVISSNFFHFNI